MTSTTTSSSYIQLRTRLLHNEALHQRWGDSPAINISLMAVAIVVVLFCLLANNIMIPSDLNNDNDNNDTDSNSNPNANNAADNSSDAVNHKLNPDEEEQRKSKYNFQALPIRTYGRGKKKASEKATMFLFIRNQLL